jgi:hypothetical protein
MHCFFVGSASPRAPGGRRTNLLGHAVSTDPDLRRWTVLTRQQPLLGASAAAPDGVENVAVVRRRAAHGGGYVMVYSEGLSAQHLARATSADLLRWSAGEAVGWGGAPPAWMGGRHGAPHVWSEGECYWMALMGEARP